MINFAVSKKAIYDWVVKQTGLRAIWENQAQHRPQLPYASLRLINPSIAVGTDEIQAGDNGNVVISGLRELVLSVNIFGFEAIEQCSVLQSTLEMPSVQQALGAKGLVYVNRSDVRDLTALIDTNFETRAQMDVRFRAAAYVEDKGTGWFESVDVHGNISTRSTDQTIGPIPEEG